MTTPSLYEQTGLYLAIHEPLAKGGRWLFDLHHEYTYWQHVGQAIGGWWQAKVALSGEKADLEEWLDNGLDRHVEAHSPDGQVFAGFVNLATLVDGRDTITVGPVMDISNRCNLYFSTIDTSVVPPIVGVRKAAGWADDLASQAQYGVLERVLSAGGMTLVDAQQVRDRYLSHAAQPKRTTMEGEGSGGPELTLEIFGHIRKTERYSYSSAVTGEQNLSDKLVAILLQEPNGVFSADLTHIQANALQVPAWENDNPDAWALLVDLLTRGDTNYDRCVLGCYEDQVLYYRTINAEPAYEQRGHDPRGAVTTPQGALVPPWLIRAGQFLYRPDILEGREFTGQDPRRLFMETVTFTAPNDFAPTGGDTDRTRQMLAQWGLAGIGG